MFDPLLLVIPPSQQLDVYFLPLCVYKVRFTQVREEGKRNRDNDYEQDRIYVGHRILHQPVS